MRSLVLFYSRSGASQMLAERLAAALDADLARITCQGYRRGLRGFGQALIHSRIGRLPTLDPLPDLAGHDLLVLVSPIWTDTFSTPMRAFLADAPGLPPRVGLALTSIGSGSHKRALPRFRAALQGPSAAELAVTGRALRSGAAEDRIVAFARTLADR